MRRAAGKRDGFEARAGSHCAQQMPDVVAHRLAAEVRLLCDLHRRATALEQPQRVSSGATTDVNWRPTCSPTRARAASFVQRTRPARSST
jgi:hypothetical protein